MTDDTSETPENGSDAELVRVAKKRFKRCQDWEVTARARWIEDVKFYNGDSDNMYQWPQAVQNGRNFGADDARPCLTINKTAQHVDQITNDARQNKTSVKIKPVGNEATYEAAQVIEGIVRHIEYISDGQSQYTHARSGQVQGGIGYLRVSTDYADEETWDQEIYVKAVPDPLSIYLDPDYQEPDASDARFAFAFADMPRDEFELQYPKYKDSFPATALGNDDGWIAEKHVRVADYWYRNEVRDTLIKFTNPLTGAESTIKRSETKGWSGDLLEALKQQLADPATKTREIIGHEVRFVKIIGNETAEPKEWAGSTIPIIPVIGKKTVIDGQLDRKGHVRAMKDSQRMLNYNGSAAIEYGALQTKTPWVAPAAAIEGQEGWEQANLINLSVLTWNHVDDEGQEIPAPFKPNPPQGAPLYQEGMKNAADDMMMVSGQYQAVLGEPSNERSGKAIQARQRQGENATYHFIDNEATALRRVGKTIVELIPKIYDTRRTMQILGEDGSTSDVTLDPNAEKAYEVRKKETEGAAEQVIMNPTIGRYDVMSDVGPDFATRRQEAFNALSQIAAQNPELMAIIGDLVMLAADFPLADEAAERLRRMVPPQAMGDGVNPQVQQLQEALHSTQGLMASMSEKLVELRGKLASKEEQKGVNIYKAITDRIEVLQKDPAGISPKEHLQFLHDLAVQEHQGNIDAETRANDAALAAQTANAA